MVGAGGDGPPHLDGAQRLLLDAMTKQLQRMIRQNNKEPYGRIEEIKNQLNHMLEVLMPIGGGRPREGEEMKKEDRDKRSYTNYSPS